MTATPARMRAASTDHVRTATTSRRRLGRSRITDHHWSCSCGARSTAPTGFSTAADARIDWLSHRGAARRGKT